MSSVVSTRLLISTDLNRVALKISASIAWLAIGIAALACSSDSAWAQSTLKEDAPATGVPAAPEEAVTAQDELVKKLADVISNTKWTGSFTMKDDMENLKTESYEIQAAEHQGDDKWVLTARIAYGGRDVTVPIPLEIKWAGRTPVITVDNLTIPGMGTFDARVLMRKGSYAGTWAHGDKGGHLFGKYKKMEAADEEAK